ncbi:type II toxin-antitoxin system VapC family toxin [Aquisphaera insulae]|uniref:type II toxin-antitoxin system VapC family toxin n=1 Tax=Aquisphaera insulae TaxID=2712864 RepID=UPI00196B587D|nr:type II toxin-antitoxin system VapC family toxin [Aquisphaera insulae]
MRRFILDTGITGLYLDRKRGVFERAAAEVVAGNRVGVAGPVVGELAFRAEGSPKRELNLLRLRDALDVWKVWLADIAAEFESGRIAFEMKTIGRPIGQNDLTIAAIAFSLGNATVVTMDADLSAVPGLTVENWAEPD